MGVFGRNCRSLDAASKPFMTGIERSKIITSGLICLAASIPFAILRPNACLETVGQECGCEHLSYCRAIIHNQDGFANTALLRINFDFHGTLVSFRTSRFRETPRVSK